MEDPGCGPPSPLRLTPLELADVTVLSKDILTVADDEILNTKVVYTIVGGEVLYQNPDL